MSEPTTIEIALTEIAQGASIYATAKKYNLTRSRLQYRAKEAGLQTSFQKNMVKDKSSKQEVLNLRRQGLPFSKISEKTGYSKGAVGRWCKEAGIVLSKEQTRENLRNTKDGSDLAIKYRLQGMFVTEIAKRLDCAKSTVCGWLRSSGVDFSDISALAKQRAIREKAQDYHSKRSLLSCGEISDIVYHERLKGFTFKEIGKRLKLNKTTVKNVFDALNLDNYETTIVSNLVKKRTLARKRSGELKPTGGLKKGCERSKFGYYKGIYCSSTYELCWVIYQLDHSNNVQRFPGYLEDPKGQFKYYPDFLAGPNHIVEIKGYEDKSVAKKTKLAQSLGYKVSLLKKEDLKDVFAYVDKSYNVNANKRFTLYDNYKPKHTLTCTGCGETFCRDNVGVNENKFCTLKCSGEWSAKQNPHKRRPPVPKRKLTDQQAMGVFLSRNTWNNIQQEFGISRKLISLIRSKKSYTWIHDDPKK